MTTKQLNVSGPRNFKEKIELLKRKEAVCTASFAAAIRDARKIRQIAGSCDFKTLKSNLAAKASGCSGPAYNERRNDCNFMKLLAESTEIDEYSAECKDHMISDNLNPLTREPPKSYSTGVKGPAFTTAPSMQTATPVQVYENEHSLPKYPSEVRPYSSYSDVHSSWRTKHVHGESEFPKRLQCAQSMHTMANYNNPYGSGQSTHPVPLRPLMTNYIPSNTLGPHYNHHTNPHLSHAHSTIGVNPAVCERNLDNQSLSAHGRPLMSNFVPSVNEFQPQVMPQECVHPSPLTSYAIQNGARGVVDHHFTPYPQQRPLPSEFVNPQPPSPRQVVSHMDSRRASSDSSIRQSVITAQSVPAPYHANHTYTEPMQPVRSVGKTPYTGPDQNVIPAKIPYTTYSSGTATQQSQYTELQSSTASLSSSVTLNHIHVSNPSRPNNPFSDPILSSSASSRSDFTQKLNSVFSCSAPNINIQAALPTPSGEMDPNYTHIDVSAPMGEQNLDRYLQIPDALLESQESRGRWVGRRDSCTMTAEVLSALSTGTADSSHTQSNQILDQYAPGSALPGQDDYDSHPPFVPNNIPGIAPSTTATCVQVVANKLGISITSNDYQLLTNPHLSNYVTDETTEAQFLR